MKKQLVTLTISITYFHNFIQKIGYLISQYLQWFKSQKVKKPERVLPPKSPGGPSGSGLSQLSKVENIGELKVAIAGESDKSIVCS